MRPACAASTGPRREVSSQGCATMVVAGGTSFAPAISRSYFEVGGLPNGLVLIALISLSVSMEEGSPLLRSTSPYGCVLMMLSPGRASQWSAQVQDWGTP